MWRLGEIEPWLLSSSTSAPPHSHFSPPSFQSLHQNDCVWSWRWCCGTHVPPPIHSYRVRALFSLIALLDLLARMDMQGSSRGCTRRHAVGTSSLDSLYVHRGREGRVSRDCACADVISDIAVTLHGHARCVTQQRSRERYLLSLTSRVPSHILLLSP